ncbi:MAG: AAA family ATPase [Actinomycetota bacterium]
MGDVNSVSVAVQDRAGMRLRLLGGFAVYVGETSVADSAFARKKARALLKLLAIQAGHRMHRDQAIDALWPDLDVQAASAQLYKAVHHVRQALSRTDPRGEGLLEFREGVLALRGEIDTDVAKFERLADDALRESGLDRLQRAIAAYAGELLPADRYEEWTLGTRDELRNKFLDLVVDLGADLIQHGNPAEAADAFRQVLVQEPSREDGHRGLMRVFALEGNRDRAARQYRMCEEILERELGVEPSGETRALHEEIETGALGGVSARGETVAVAPGLVGPLVGRDQEVATARRHLDDLAQGSGSSLTIEGPAGIGKTRLAHEVLQLARARGNRVAYGRARSREGRIPYAPLIDALGTMLRADPSGAEHIPAELGVVMPEVAIGPSVGSADGLASRNALFASVLRFLDERAHKAPLVVVLDDLHSADQGTIRALRYLTGRIGSIPLMTIACWRTDEPGSPQRLHAVAEAAAERIMLGPLVPAEHQALVSQTLGGGPVQVRAAEDLFGLGGGNPLFTAELVRQLLAANRLVRRHGEWELATGVGRAEPVPVPSSLHALLQERLGTLSDAGRTLLDLAAVIGEVLPLEILHACVRTQDARMEDVDALLDMVDEAIDGRLMEETGLGYRFLHPLLREGVLRQIASPQRRFLHRRVARTLESIGPERDQPVEALAYHYREAGDIPTAVGYLMAAGDRAESVYDHDDAVLRFEEALSLLGDDATSAGLRRRAELHERVGDVHRNIGRLQASIDSYKNALTDLGSSGNGARRGLHRKIALGAVMAADIPTAGEHLRMAQEATGPGTLEEARNLIVEALIDWHLNRLEKAVGLGELALEIAEREGARREIAQACEMLALAHLPQGNWEEGLRYELRREADWSPDLVLATDAHMCLWEYRIRGEDPHRRAKAFIDAVAEQAATMGNLRCLAVCHYALGSIGLARGDFELGRDHLTRSLELHEGLGSPAGVAFTLARLLGLETDVGGGEGSDLFLRALEAAHDAAIRDHVLLVVHGAGMRNRLSAGDTSAATEIMASAERLEAESSPCPICSIEMLPIMAAVYLETDDASAAEACAYQAAELAQLGHNQVGAARAAAVTGRIHARRGDDASAARYFAEAGNAFRTLGHRFELATTLQAWGALPDGATAAAEAEQILSSLRS